MRPITALLVLTAAALSTPHVARGQTADAGALAPTTTSATARTEFDRALWHWQHAFPTRAVAHLERALEIDPQFGLARVFRGGLKPGLSATERQTEMSRGLAALSAAPAGEIAVALAWREQWSGRAPASRPLMAAAAELLPGDGQVAFWNVQRQLPSVPQDQRIEALRATTRKHPGFSVTYRQLGYLLFRTGDRQGGLEAMRDYVRIDPEHPNTHASLGELFHFAGQGADAEREFRRAQQLDSAWSGWAYLADIQLVNGNAGAARELWGRAIAHSPGPTDSLDHQHTLALVGFLEGDAAGALRQLGELATRAESRRFNGAATLMHQRMAVLEASAGNATAAEGHLSRAAQLGGDNTGAQHAHTSLSYALLRQSDRARTSAEKFSGVSTWPANKFRHTLDGLVALQTGDPAGASAQLTQSEPIDVLAKALLAEAYQAQGRAADAARLRQEVQRSATMLYGSHLMDFYAALGKVRARRTS